MPRNFCVVVRRIAIDIVGAEESEVIHGTLWLCRNALRILCAVGSSSKYTVYLSLWQPQFEQYHTSLLNVLESFHCSRLRRGMA